MHSCTPSKPTEFKSRPTSALTSDPKAFIAHFSLSSVASFIILTENMIVSIVILCLLVNSSSYARLSLYNCLIVNSVLKNNRSALTMVIFQLKCSKDRCESSLCWVVQPYSGLSSILKQRCLLQIAVIQFFPVKKSISDIHD